jgi:hypothetical protein
MTVVSEPIREGDRIQGISKPNPEIVRGGYNAEGPPN